MRIIHRDGSTYSVSIWMKQYFDGHVKRYCLVLQEVPENVIRFQVNPEGHVFVSNEGEGAMFSFALGYENVPTRRDLSELRQLKDANERMEGQKKSVKMLEVDNILPSISYIIKEVVRSSIGQTCSSPSLAATCPSPQSQFLTCFTTAQTDQKDIFPVILRLHPVQSLCSHASHPCSSIASTQCDPSSCPASLPSPACKSSGSCASLGSSLSSFSTPTTPVEPSIASQSTVPIHLCTAVFSSNLCSGGSENCFRAPSHSSALNSPNKELGTSIEDDPDFLNFPPPPPPVYQHPSICVSEPLLSSSFKGFSTFGKGNVSEESNQPSIVKEGDIPAGPVSNPVYLPLPVKHRSVSHSGLSLNPYFSCCYSTRSALSYCYTCSLRSSVVKSSCYSEYEHAHLSGDETLPQPINENYLTLAHFQIELVFLQNLSGVIQVCPITGHILSCSSTFTKYLFGYSSRDLLKCSIPITRILPDFYQYVDRWKKNLFVDSSPIQCIRCPVATTELRRIEEEFEEVCDAGEMKDSTLEERPSQKPLCVKTELSPIEAPQHKLWLGIQSLTNSPFVSPDFVTALHRNGSQFNVKMEISKLPRSARHSSRPEGFVSYSVRTADNLRYTVPSNSNRQDSLKPDSELSMNVEHRGHDLNRAGGSYLESIPGGLIDSIYAVKIHFQGPLSKSAQSASDVSISSPGSRMLRIPNGFGRERTRKGNFDRTVPSTCILASNRDPIVASPSLPPYGQENRGPDILQMMESPSSCASPDPIEMISDCAILTHFKMVVDGIGHDPGHGYSNKSSHIPSIPRRHHKTTLPLHIDGYDILRCLGEGAYGTVHLARSKDDPKNDQLYVIKFIVRSKILSDGWICLSSATDSTLENLKQLGEGSDISFLPSSITSSDEATSSASLFPLEVHILSYLQQYPHQNIMSLSGFFCDALHYYVLTPLVGSGMDLFDFIDQTPTVSAGQIPSTIIQKIFWQVADAIRHLHSHGIVHRDIKDENIVIDEDHHVKLIDFGSAAFLQKDKKFTTFCGTVDYAAPEVLRGRSYEGPPQDIWALGILLYTLIYRENPFRNMDEILTGSIRIPFVESKESVDLIMSMLSRDVSRRPRIDQVMNHPFFSSYPLGYK